MNDVEARPKDLEQLWERLIKDCRRSSIEAISDDYFMGIFDGCMASLAIVASYLGRMEEYIVLCQELDCRIY